MEKNLSDEAIRSAILQKLQGTLYEDCREVTSHDIIEARKFLDADGDFGVRGYEHLEYPHDGVADHPDFGVPAGNLTYVIGVTYDFAVCSVVDASM